MNISVIEYIKKTDTKTIALAAMEGIDTPVIYKELPHGNLSIYEKLKSISSAFFPHIYALEEGDNHLKVCEEYVPGESLANFLLTPKFTVNSMFDTAFQLCDALITLHSQTPPIIHRDIKPDNIIITNKYKITLVDFDIARHFRPDSADTDTRLLGTVSYAAPEQFGYSQTDERTDIYSLGIVLRQMMTATVPGLSGRQLNQFQKIVNRCTSFDPEARYPSVQNLKKDLSALYASYKRSNNRALKLITYFVAGIMTLCLVFFAIFTINRNFKNAEENSTATTLTEATSTVSSNLPAHSLSFEPDYTETSDILQQTQDSMEAQNSTAANSAESENEATSVSESRHDDASTSQEGLEIDFPAGSEPEADITYTSDPAFADFSASASAEETASAFTDISDYAFDNESDSAFDNEPESVFDPLSVDYLTTGSFTLSDNVILTSMNGMDSEIDDFILVSTDGSPISDFTIEFSIPKDSKLRMLSYADSFLYEGTHSLVLEPPYPGAEKPTYKYTLSNNNNRIKLTIKQTGDYALTSQLYLDYKMKDGTIYNPAIICKYSVPYEVFSDGPAMTYLTYTHTFSLWQIIHVSEANMEEFCEKIADGRILILLSDTPATPVLEDGIFKGSLKTDFESNYVIVYDSELKLRLYSGIFVIEIND